MINVEAGKMKGWLKTPQDIQSEFEVSETLAIELFGDTSLRLMVPSNVKLLSS